MSSTRRPAPWPRRSAWRRRRTWTMRSPPPAGRSRHGAPRRPARRAAVMFEFRNLLNRHTDELAEMLSAEHGKTISDAKGELARGIEVVEFACGIPQLPEGRIFRRRGGGHRQLRHPPAGGRRGGHHAVQLPGDGAALDVSGLDRLRQRLRAEALRARPVRGGAHRGTAQPGRAAGRRDECGQRRQGSRGRRSWTIRTSTRSASSAPPRSASTSMPAARRRASGCRRSAGRRTISSSCRTPIWGRSPTR